MSRYIEKLEGALEIAKLKEHGLKLGMNIRIDELVNEKCPNPKAAKKHTYHGEVVAINDRIFTIREAKFGKMESFHLVDLIGTGKLEVRMAG